MKCVNCNKEIKEGLKFCPHCGASQTVTAGNASPKKKKNIGMVISIIVVVIIMVIITIGIIISTINDDSTKVKNDNSSSATSLNRSEKQLNHQLEPLDLVGGNNYFKYSLTNGGEYLRHVYEFGIYGKGINNIDDIQDYESECDKKTAYEYYQNGKKDIRIIQNERDKTPDIYYKMFDDNGNVSVYKESHIDSSGAEQFYEYKSYQYDEKNNLIESSDDSGETVQYYYDENDNLTQIITTNSSSYSTQTNYELTLDENDNIIEKIQFDDGQESYTYRYQYEGGKLICESIFKPDGTEDERKEYEYENDQLISYKRYEFHSKEYYPEDSFELEEEFYFEYDEDDFLISYSNNYLGINTSVNITYDEYHNIQLIEKNRTDQGNVYYIFEYTDEPVIVEYENG